MVTLPAMPKYDVYKDSGVEWLGLVPEHWHVKRVSNNYSLINGFAFDSKKFSSDVGHSLVRIRDIYKKSPEAFYNGKFVDVAEINDGDLLVGMDGDFNVALWSGGKALLNQRVCCLRSSFDVDVKFLYYCLQFPLKIINDLTFSTTVKHLSSFDVLKIKVPFLPLKEKEQLILFLDNKTSKIEEAIAIKEKQITLLKERKQIIIQKAVTQGLNPNVPMKDSSVEWVGKIPEHWEVLANRALFIERVEPGQEGLPLLSVSIHSGVSSEEISEEDNVRGRVKIEDKSKYILVKEGDIAFNMMRAWQGGIGAVSTDGMVSPAYIVAKPSIRISAEYFEYQYRCPEFIQQMDRFSKGITDFRKRLYWDSFKQLATVVPPVGEQKEIITYIVNESKKIDKVIQLFVRQIEKLKEYKTTLINSAVTGKIKVSEISYNQTDIEEEMI